MVAARRTSVKRGGGASLRGVFYRVCVCVRARALSQCVCPFCKRPLQHPSIFTVPHFSREAEAQVKALT